MIYSTYDDVIKWKHFPRYWPFVRGIHCSPVNSPHKGQWHGASMFLLICAWNKRLNNNLEAGDLRRHRGHYVVTVMILGIMHAVVFSLASFYKIRCIFGAETNIIAWSSSYILVYKRCGIGQNFGNLTWIYENRYIIISNFMPLS